jgi:spore coat polysaccharide biosynthesis protein SpsF (cytidylyltransferase family)
MSSTRLPGKVLADLGGRPVLEWVVSRLRDSRELADVTVATSDEPDDDPVAEAAAGLGARVVRGPLADVLARYAIAARELGAQGLVRITADCPLIDPAVVDRVVRVDYEHALEMARRLAREEGIFCGISSGAITWAARDLAKELGEGKRLVSIICDFGERYLSHELFETT